MKMSKTQAALALVRESGMTPYAAAKQVGISSPTIYGAIRRQKNKEICPCCGQIVRAGFAVNRKALKKSSSGQ
jgi:hypothetical protein